MARRIALVLSLAGFASPAPAEEEPVRLPPVEVRALYPLTPPQYRDTPLPQYPSAAREQRLEGTVLLEVLVRADGRVGEARVKQSSGAPVLDEAALETVRRWTFVPAQRGPVAVDSWVEVPVRFSLVTR